MKNNSIKKNLLMNMILTLSSYLFPLITFPYISRVLQASGYGKVNFAISIVNYFIMFASLGIPIYGVRICAINRDDKEKLSKSAQELFIINIFTTTISYLILFLCALKLEQIEAYRTIILILSSAMLLNLFGFDWLYRALEEYTYITISSLIFKFIAIFLMFVLIHNEGDINKYALVSVITTSGAMLLNCLRVHKYIILKPYNHYELKKHIKPILMLFLLSASWTVYTNLDTVMLGFICGDTQVGYYSVAIKMKLILVSSISALSSVLLPRLSNYYNKDNYDKFIDLLKKDTNFILVMSLAVSAFFIINAKETILIISGETYLDAVNVMQAVMPAIVFIGISTMLGTNILVPMQKEKITIYATLTGIVLDFILNLFWIPKYGAFGAAVATLCGEVVIVIFEALHLKEEIKMIFNLTNIKKIILSFIISTVLLFVVKLLICNYINNVFITFTLSGLIFVFVYFSLLYKMSEEFVTYIVIYLKNKISK